MPAVTLLVSALLALGTSAGFATIAILILARRAGATGHGARQMFALFWASASIVFAAQGLQTLAGYLGRASFGLVSALDQVTTPFYCLAAASLLYYALYLLTGKERLLVPILLYNLAMYVLLRWRIEDARRVDVRTEAWFVSFEYAQPLQGPAYTAIVALLTLPLVGAILGYGALAFRIRDPAARYRIALTTIGLLAWVGTEAVSYASGFAGTTQGELTRRLVALGATLIVLLAYRPPRFARERWGAQAAL